MSIILTRELQSFPLIPLRDTVLFPCLATPLLIGRERSLRALEAAVKGDRKVVLVTQKHGMEDDPLTKHLHRVGTLADIHQVVRLPDNSVKILVEGLTRVRIARVQRRNPSFLAAVEPLEQIQPDLNDTAEDGRWQVLRRVLLDDFAKFVGAHPKLSEAAYESVQDIVDLDQLTDAIASFLPAATADKQALLAECDIGQRAITVGQLLHRHIDLIQIEREIHAKVRQQVEKSQREFFLREQLKVIQSELGEDLDDLAELKQQLEDAGIDREHWPRVERELKRLEQLPGSSAEAGVIRNYLEWLATLPWAKEDAETLDLKLAEDVLDREHYGLIKVKERILEFLAVRHLLVQQQQAANPPVILCLVGPPGVGKTSLAQSIANSLGRQLVRVSLGGVHDESDVRGHRRTYVGSMPGRILQALRNAGTRNPVMLLDEVDKMGQSFQGDPAAALLEVLDPEQNATFSDRYIDIPFNLSQVFFVCTANTADTIPRPLLDRMEVVRIGGYTEAEKVAISRRYLLPKQLQQNGLAEKALDVKPKALERMIREYTREAGVRNLERTIGSLCRKAARRSLDRNKKSQQVTARNLETYLGQPKYLPEAKDTQDRVGICTGLAWTPYGGCTLPIEVNIMSGKGKLQLTGQLGDVMKESAQAAFSFIRAHASDLNVPDEFPDLLDVHIHIPEGATPKDGPSAGIAMATALISALTGRKVRHDVAMTGEITLRGRVLAIGGLKEKTLAASQVGITQVLFPKANIKDLPDIPDEVKSTVELIPVDYLAEVLDVALEKRSPEAQAAILPWMVARARVAEVRV
ncbi:MAG: endopeptidase La [Cyanobacteria bacterium P01_D01_bin.123]